MKGWFEILRNGYKLVCLDLDGTLLTSKHVMDEETKEYLKKLSNEGIHITIATGRAAFDAKYYAGLVNDNTHFICSNGAALGVTKEKRLLFEDCFDDNAINELCSAAQEIGCNPVFYTKNYIICTGLKEFLFHNYFMFKSGNKGRNRLRYVFGVKGFLKYYKKNNFDIQKSLFFLYKKDKATKVYDLLSKDVFELAQLSEDYFEISKSGVNKSHAVRKLAEHLGVSTDEVIAFGDSDNDREMLKLVGKGVAMWNAPKAIRDIADEITESNDDQGILIKLKEIFEKIE